MKKRNNRVRRHPRANGGNPGWNIVMGNGCTLIIESRFNGNGNLARQPEKTEVKTAPTSAAKREYTDEELRNKINNIMPMIRINRQWFCILKVLMLHGLLADNDFEGGRKLILKLFPAGVNNMFDPADIAKLHTGCFKFPIDKWTISDSPFKREAEFAQYMNLAMRFDELF